MCDSLQELLMSLFPILFPLKLLEDHLEILRKDNVEKMPSRSYLDGWKQPFKSGSKYNHEFLVCE